MTLTSPVSLLVTTMSGKPLPVVSTSATSETPTPTCKVMVGTMSPVPLRRPVTTLSGITVRVPSPALRTTRSFPPSPIRSPKMICAGNDPVGIDPTRRKPPAWYV